MELFDVYSLFNVTPVRAKGCKVWDDKGQEYLDLYGGHAVISVGHCHPHYNEVLTDQLGKIGFYSNSVRNPLQEELARRIGIASGYEDYSLFLCMVYFFDTGRKFFLTTTIYNMNFSSETKCCSCCIHSNVTTTYNYALLGLHDRCSWRTP